MKICPCQAIECRHYADVVPLGASVQPRRGEDSILWTIRFRNGREKRFEFPIGTTPAGTAEPYAGGNEAVLSELADPGVLFTRGTHAYDASQFARR